LIGGIQQKRSPATRLGPARHLRNSRVEGGKRTMDTTNSFVEDSVSRMIEPDILTPEQHRDRVRMESVDQPEIRLMLAVMEDAVATFQRFLTEPRKRNRRQFDEVRDWIRSSDTSWPYSFENICTALQFEPEIVRRGLDAWETAPESVSGMYRFPFRRVNGKRHSISLRDREAEKQSA